MHIEDVEKLYSRARKHPKAVLVIAFIVVTISTGFLTDVGEQASRSIWERFSASAKQKGIPPPEEADDFARLSQEAAALASETATFLAKAIPPTPTLDHEKSMEVYDEFQKLMASEFAELFLQRILRLQRAMEAKNLGDYKLDWDIDWLPVVHADIPRRLDFISQHIIDPVEREALVRPYQRIVTTRERSILRDELRGTVHSLLIAYPLNTREAQRYAESISDAFIEAGWSATTEGVEGYSGGSSESGYTGVMKIIGPERRQSPDVLEAALDRIRLDLKTRRGIPNYEGGSIYDRADVLFFVGTIPSY